MKRRVFLFRLITSVQLTFLAKGSRRQKEKQGSESLRWPERR